MRRSTFLRSLALRVTLGSFVGSWGALPSSAAQILDLDRRVITSSFVDVYQGLGKDDAVGHRSQQPGDFLEAAVGGALIGDFTNAFGEALQETDVRFGPGEGFRIDGSGGVGFGFDVADPGYPSRAQGSADSTLTITFEISVPLAYAFGLSLAADLVQLEIQSGLGPVAGTASAFARLYGLSSGLLLDLVVEDSTADGVATETERVLSGVLAPGVYSLEVGATTFLRGFEDSTGLAQSGFGIDFVAAVVPEPGTGILIAFGLGLLARKRRSGDRLGRTQGT